MRLPAAHRWLARDPKHIARQFAERQLEPRIIAQCVEIIGVFIATRDCQHSGTHDVSDAMDHTALIAWISDAGGQPIVTGRLLRRVVRSDSLHFVAIVDDARKEAVPLFRRSPRLGNHGP